MLIAHLNHEIDRCFAVLSELRPHLVRSSFIAAIRHMQNQGYVLAYLVDKDEVRAVAGFRIYFDLSVGGNALYIYDLVVAEDERSKGFGKKLLSDMVDYAKLNECKCVHLDSNTNRHGAHKFYLENGFKINAFHFLNFFE